MQKLEILDHRIQSLKYTLSSTEYRLLSQLSTIEREIRKRSVHEGRIVVIIWVTTAGFLWAVCILAELMSQEKRREKLERESKASGEFWRDK